MLEELNIPAETLSHIEADIKAAEKELDDDAESIITNDRYVYIGEIIKGSYQKKNAGALTTSDKISMAFHAALYAPGGNFCVGFIYRPSLAVK